MSATKSHSSSVHAETRLRLGARASALSLAQSGLIARRLEACHPRLRVEIVPVSTTGDQIQDQPLHALGGKGLFTKQLEQALLAGAVDFAVHSYKDVPVTMPLVDQENLIVAATPVREDVRDVLVSTLAQSIRNLPLRAHVGTGSLRRMAQLHDLRPDLRVSMIRGNIDTRLRKLRSGEFDAIVLAAAGLRRANLFDEDWMTPIPETDMLPAAAQGALAIQCRRDAAETRKLLGALNHADTALAVTLEREVVELLEGDCHSPIGALATIGEHEIMLRAALARRDGMPPVVKAEVAVARNRAGQAARKVVESLMLRGAGALLCKQMDVR